MTTGKKTIHAKLIDARKEFHSTSIKKTGYNSFSKYYYFELADFLLPAMDMLAKQDLIAVTSFETELATMTVTDVNTGESIVITSPMSTATLKACQPVQSMGACQTFVRRYLYTTLFEIVEHDVIEEQTGKPEKPAAKKPDAKLATSTQKGFINAQDDAHIPARRLSWLQTEDNFDKMTEAQAKVIIGEIEELMK